MANTPETQEIATIGSDPMVPAWQNALEPQDETLRTRGAGKGFALYDEIRRDPHAFSVLQKRYLEVVAHEWAVEPASKRRVDRQAAEEVERQLKGFSFDKLTMGLMGAVLKGFAVAEILWENREGVWTAAKVKVRRQRRFRMTVDGELRLLTRDASLDGIALPSRKFIVHRHSIDNDDDDPYGLGIGTVLFWPAWFKRQVLAFWLRASERFASPAIKATYQGDFDQAKTDKLLAAIRAMANDAGIVIPASVNLDLLEAKLAAGGSAHEQLSRYLDELISEAVLGETLSTNSGERGARSLGEVHNDVRLMIAKADADLLCATINDTLVRWICELNYPTAALPQVWRTFEEPDDLDKRADRDAKIVDMGYIPRDVSYINETYGGDWVEKAPAGDGTAPPTTALDTLFAEAQQRTPDAILADQLAELARAPLAAMLDKIRAAASEAVSYEDLADRLLAIVPDLDPSDLGTVMEQAMRVGQLAGMASVTSEGTADGG